MSTARIRLLAISLLCALFGLPVAALLWMTTVPGRSHAGALPPLSAGEARLAERLRRHVRAIARAPHNIDHPAALEQAARHIERALIGMGYVVHRQSFLAGGQTVRNIEVVIDSATIRTPTLVIGAHYDSHGDAPGANDNASGAASVIELARSLADLRGKSTLRIRLVLFVNEEPPWFKTPLMGSLVYARHLKASREPMLGMISLETIGYYSDRPRSQHYPAPLDMLYPDRGDFVAFVGTPASRGLVRWTTRTFRATTAFPSEGGVAPGFIQGIDWSDHWSFVQVGIPALMVTDTALFRYPYYHSAGDTPEKIDYDRLARVVTGLERTIRRIR